MKPLALYVLVSAILLTVLQGCNGMEVKPPSEFPYQRAFHPAG